MFDRYILKKFFPVFLLSIFFFSFVVVLIDLFINIFNYISMGVPFLKVMQVELLFLPKAMSYSIPLSVLFATSYSLSNLYAKNELTSIFASGISLFRFTLPILITSLILSIGFLFFDDFLVVPTLSKKEQLQDTLLHRSTNLNNNMIVIRGDGGKRVYRVTFYDNEQKRLHGIYIVQRDDNNRLSYIVIADSALWINEKWEVYGAKVYKIDGENLVMTSLNLSDYTFIEEGPEIFKKNVISIQTVNIREAKVYINHLKRVGLPYNKELSEYYKKFSFPFVVFLVAFLSIGLSGKTRKNVLLLSLAFSLSAAVGFYVMQMITMLMAGNGKISPFMGAWFPVIVFFVLSIVFLRHART
ncbi:MAG: LptF/LptG family permease [Treponemataceae bacterium]|nr:LptF/LptG family permease [Treponemataceae bacterium]